MILRRLILSLFRQKLESENLCRVLRSHGSNRFRPRRRWRQFKKRRWRSPSGRRERMGRGYEAKEWIGVDESAQEMLQRASIERPCLIVAPPLHRVPLRPGNVVELVGPSSSARSEILLQAAINCILPKVWDGIFFGGMERLVMYFDLDCSFDVQRFSNSLKKRIAEAFGNATVGFEQNKHPCNHHGLLAELYFNEDLYASCMRRFSYIRCYSSFEFLASLKTIRRQMQKESEAHGVGVLYLMIDSINVFYWIDRASSPWPIGSSRNCLSFQSVSETVVQELRKLLHVQPVLVLATKTTILGVGSSVCQSDRNLFASSSSLINSNTVGFDFYQEYMPPAWQSLVTQRILLQITGDALVSDESSSPIYVSKWLLPSLNLSDKFVVTDEGITLVG